jgi:hypothetical protein
MGRFMNKNTSLLSIAMTILLSSTIAFTAENNNDRYNEICAALSSLSEDFVFHSSDIQLVEEHKAALQKELDSYKNSWAPTLLKTLGAGFALETAIRGISITLRAHPRILYKVGDISQLSYFSFCFYSKQIDKSTNSYSLEII